MTDTQPDALRVAVTVGLMNTALLVIKALNKPRFDEGDAVCFLAALDFVDSSHSGIVPDVITYAQPRLRLHEDDMTMIAKKIYNGMEMAVKTPGSSKGIAWDPTSWQGPTNQTTEPAAFQAGTAEKEATDALNAPKDKSASPFPQQRIGEPLRRLVNQPEPAKELNNEHMA